MNIDAAKRAGEIAAGIDARVRLRALVELAIAENWPIIEVVAKNPVTLEAKSLIIGQLDAATSASGLAFIKGVYDAEITALQSDLATAETWTPPT